MNPTLKDAVAAGLDAGNRSMRKAGRIRWNQDDKDAATEAWEKVAALIPQCGAS